MCLIALAWGCHEAQPLVIAGNRDEFAERPSAPLQVWTSDAGRRIASGRDLREGGTWAGFTPQGRFAMLTNVREPEATSSAGTDTPHLISRGQLVMQWLHAEVEANDWAHTVKASDYRGFNLIVGDWRRQSLHFISNRPRPGLHCEALRPGQVYGLSNASLDTPWPKTRLLKQTLSQHLGSSALSTQLLATLARRQGAPDEASLPSTGIPIAIERALSSPFVRVQDGDKPPHYGTRASWIAQLSPEGQLQLREWTHPQVEFSLDHEVALVLDWA
jgi:uncharacterized protein with NRDE domain